MFFTDTGHVHWLKVHEIPQGGRAARGKPVVNCIAIQPEEMASATGRTPTPAVLLMKILLPIPASMVSMLRLLIRRTSQTHCLHYVPESQFYARNPSR